MNQEQFENRGKNLIGQQKTEQMSARRALTADLVPLPWGTGMLDSDSAITKGKHQARTTGTEPASFPFYPA